MGLQELDTTYQINHQHNTESRFRRKDYRWLLTQHDLPVGHSYQKHNLLCNGGFQAKRKLLLGHTSLTKIRNCPAGKWLRFHAFILESLGSIPGWGTKIPWAMHGAAPTSLTTHKMLSFTKGTKWTRHRNESSTWNASFNPQNTVMEECVSPSVMSNYLRAHQAPLYMKFSRQEYWNGLPFPSPGDLPDSRTEPGSPAFQADSLLSEPPGKHTINISRSTDERNIVQRSQVICSNL